MCEATTPSLPPSLPPAATFELLELVVLACTEAMLRQGLPATKRERRLTHGWLIQLPQLTGSQTTQCTHGGDDKEEGDEVVN